MEPLLYAPLVPMAETLVKWAVEVTRLADEGPPRGRRTRSPLRQPWAAERRQPTSVPAIIAQSNKTCPPRASGLRETEVGPAQPIATGSDHPYTDCSGFPRAKHWPGVNATRCLAFVNSFIYRARSSPNPD
jgi:hypothetical protein